MVNKVKEIKRVMVVTGASSGVGRAVSLYFGSRGYTICALARSQDKLEALEEEGKGNIHAYSVDISDSNLVRKTFEKIMEDNNQIDVLINNAGMAKVGTFWEQSIDDIDLMIDLNLKGTMYCTHSVLNLSMIPNKSGRIINISSTAGLRTSPRATIYQASKHGQVGFGSSIAQALLSYNILVTTLCPGGIKTPLWSGDNLKAAPDVNPENFMDPDELSETIEFVLNRPVTTLFKQMLFFPTSEWA